ncbi:MAG: ATP-binding cassette domain-containing protein [Chloroflexi bacterium]|nr:ATP-binding cassette domain-containing protein [Chloroflexota bacterium]
MNHEPIVEAKDLVKDYPKKEGFLIERRVGWNRVVDGVSFTLLPGETLSLVGESGCGKTVVARMVMTLVKPTAGTILFRGDDVFRCSPQTLREYRRTVHLVYQNPLLSLNPRRTVGESIALPIRNFGLYNTAKERAMRVAEVLETVGLNGMYANRYPHEFSGGQIQRVGIARGLASGAQVFVLDEPVSALDVSIQAQILNLLRDLKESLGLTMLFIGNNLNVIQHVADRIVVLCHGRMIEVGPTSSVFAHPLHPHTRRLLDAILSVDRAHRASTGPVARGGEVAMGREPAIGCSYAEDCPQACGECRSAVPQLRTIEAEHSVACHQIEPLTHSTKECADE